MQWFAHKARKPPVQFLVSQPTSFWGRCHQFLRALSSLDDITASTAAHETFRFVGLFLSPKTPKTLVWFIEITLTRVCQWRRLKSVGAWKARAWSSGSILCFHAPLEVRQHQHGTRWSVNLPAVAPRATFAGNASWTTAAATLQGPGHASASAFPSQFTPEGKINILTEIIWRKSSRNFV